MTKDCPGGISQISNPFPHVGAEKHPHLRIREHIVINKLAHSHLLLTRIRKRDADNFYSLLHNKLDRHDDWGSQHIGMRKE